MIELNISQGLSTDLFQDGELNPRILIEEGCWYLCTDTAELFLGVRDSDGELVLKQINHPDVVNKPAFAPSQGNADRGVIGAYIEDTSGELYLVFSDDTEESLGVVVGKDGQVTTIKVNNVAYEHINGIIELPSFATKEFVEGYVNSKLTASQPPSTNGVLFTTSKIVTNPIGGFMPGEDLCGYTTAELFAKLLGLEDGEIVEPDEPEHEHNFVNGECACGAKDPNYIPPDEPEQPNLTLDELIEKIKDEQIYIYQANADGELVPTDYSYTVLTELEYNGMPAKEGFYQLIDDNGTITESGYHQFTAYNNSCPYMVALPEGIDFNTQISVKKYDEGLSLRWKEVSFYLENDYDVITALFESIALAPPSIPEGYVLWVSKRMSNTSSIYRLAIKERSS